MNPADQTTYTLTTQTFVPNDPSLSSQMMAYNLLMQMKNLPNQEKTFATGTFKERSDTDVSQSLSEKIYNAWKLDVSKVMTNNTKSKVPVTKIAYAKSYELDPENEDSKPIAGYQLTFTDEWLESAFPKGDLTSDEKLILKGSNNSINITFDKSLDSNPSRDGQFNNTPTLIEVNNDRGKQKEIKVSYGGIIKIALDHKKEYIMTTTPVGVDAKNTLTFDTPIIINLSKKAGQDKRIMQEIIDKQREALSQIALRNLILMKQQNQTSK